MLSEVLKNNKIKVGGFTIVNLDKLEAIHELRTNTSLKLIIKEQIVIKKDWIHQGNLEIVCEKEFILNEMSNLNVTGSNNNCSKGGVQVWQNCIWVCTKHNINPFRYPSGKQKQLTNQ
jgi:hypothetical protein